jgi:hypothetical protein
LRRKQAARRSGFFSAHAFDRNEMLPVAGLRCGKPDGGRFNTVDLAGTVRLIQFDGDERDLYSFFI